MLYYLLAPLGKKYLLFNLFNYISFRAAAAMVTALLLAFVVGPGHHREAPGPEGRPGHPRRRAREPPGQARHADDGRRSSSCSRRSSRRCSGPGWTTASCCSRCWRRSGWAASASSTTTSRSCRASRAGWWPSGSWWGSAPSASRWACCSTVYPVVPVDTIPATATTLPFFKYLVVNFAPLALRRCS